MQNEGFATQFGRTREYKITGEIGPSKLLERFVLLVTVETLPATVTVLHSVRALCICTADTC